MLINSSHTPAGTIDMLTKFEQLEKIIYQYDSLIEEWLNGNIASLYITDNNKSVHEFSDELRNTALELIFNLKESIPIE